MQRCDGCNAKPVVVVTTEWGKFHFCGHCWQRNKTAIKPVSTQYLDKVYDHATMGL